MRAREGGGGDVARAGGSERDIKISRVSGRRGGGAKKGLLSLFVRCRVCVRDASCANARDKHNDYVRARDQERKGSRSAARSFRSSSTSTSSHRRHRRPSTSAFAPSAASVLQYNAPVTRTTPSAKNRRRRRRPFPSSSSAPAAALTLSHSPFSLSFPLMPSPSRRLPLSLSGHPPPPRSQPDGPPGSPRQNDSTRRRR